MSSRPTSSTSADASTASSRPVMNVQAPYQRAGHPDTEDAESLPSSAAAAAYDGRVDHQRFPSDRSDGIDEQEEEEEEEEEEDEDVGDDGSEGQVSASNEDGAASTHTATSSAAAAAALDRPRDEEFDAIERRARIALEDIATREEDVEPHMGEYVDVLQVYRTACQERAMYREAYLVQQVLRNLRLEEETRHVRGITEQQMEERRVLEEAHREEFREFHHAWNARIDVFEEEQLEAEISLLERQNNELVQFQEEMRDYQPRLPKYSRALLDSRSKQQILARMRDYVGAQTQKEKADALELADMERYEGARMEAFERREYAVRHRHQQELLALRTKVESRRLYLERYRKQELDVLLQRYINVRRAMESQQNIVRNKTGTLLLKHACNTKTDNSGTAVLVESAGSGAFGTTVQRRQADELRAAHSQSAVAARPTSESGEM